MGNPLNRFTGQPERRLLCGSCIFLHHDKKTDSIVPVDQLGIMLKHEEVKELIKVLQLYKKKFSQEFIKYSNDERLKDFYSEGPARNVSEKRKKIMGHVYFLKSEYGTYKIGKTKQLGQRISSYKQLPFTTELVCTVRVSDIGFAEKVFHKLFSEKRDKGEWFKLTQDDINKIINRDYPEEIKALVIQDV